MATIKHPDTFKCDVCGREIERAHSITLPVRWTTEQNEGRPCTPYVKEETIDLCDECFERAVVIEAAGCMGRNSYRLASEEERGAYDEAQKPDQGDQEGHDTAVHPIDEPITMADLNANTAIGYDMVGTLKVGGDAPSVCL